MKVFLMENEKYKSRMLYSMFYSGSLQIYFMEVVVMEALHKSFCKVHKHCVILS